MSEIKYRKIDPKDSEIDGILYKYFTSGYRKGYIEVGDCKCVLPDYYMTIADEIENLEVRDTDVWLTSHPKCGTTWTEEMLWMLINNLDFEGAKQDINQRVPFMEFQCLFNYTDDSYAEVRKNAPDSLLKSVEMTKNFPKNPRIIKTHMPFDLLPKQIRDKTKQPKIVHVMRNPKDTCVSYYYHCRLLEGYTGNFEDFCQLFLHGKINWTPYWMNLLSYWKRRNDYNMLIIKFEDMKKDLGSVILQVANFLNKPINDEQLTILEDHLSFKKMKHNNSVNLEAHCAMTRKLNKVEGTFMRSGTVGSYKADMSEEMIRIFNEWTEENTAGTGLYFDDNL